MLRPATVFAAVRACKAKCWARPIAFLSVRPVPAATIARRFTVLSGSLVVFAATSSPVQTSSLSAKDLAAISKKADELFSENKFEEILKLLRPHKNCRKEEVAWRISRAAYTLSKSKSISKADHAALVEESYEMAKLTLELNEKSALGHKWMSIALDAYSGLQGFRTRCGTLVAVKDHMLKSLEFDPSDATVIHMVGMWYYGIADLAWYQRSILQAIAGKPPPATYEEALSFFKKAEETSPNFYSINLLMLGKVYLKLGDQDTAVAYLRRAINYPQFTDDDHQAHQEASDLLKSLKIA